MLTDIAIKRLKPKDELYKVADRDGMYVSVATTGQITFRYDDRLDGRRETLTIITPPLPETAHASAKAKGRERFTKFLNTLGWKLATGDRFLKDLSHDIDPRREGTVGPPTET